MMQENSSRTMFHELHSSTHLTTLEMKFRSLSIYRRVLMIINRETYGQAVSISVRTV